MGTPCCPHSPQCSPKAGLDVSAPDCSLQVGQRGLCKLWGPAGLWDGVSSTSHKFLGAAAVRGGGLQGSQAQGPGRA